MKQIYKDNAGKIIIKETSEPVIKEGFVKIKTQYSLISSGTETRSLTEGQGLFKTILKKSSSLGRKNADASPLGYCAVGEVLEIGSDVLEVGIGDKVVCSGFGYAVHAETVMAPKNLVCCVPEGLELEASFTAIGSVALHAIRRCQVQLGETILVIGLGLTGQLVAQLLRLSGCKVIGIDRNEHKLKVAKDTGIDVTHLGKNGFKKTVLDFTKQNGVDGAIYCADIYESDQFEEVASVVRDKGRIITIGHVKTLIPTAVLFRKEIDLMSCRSFGPGRFDSNYEEKGIDYPIGYVRWTEKRNMEEIVDLIKRQKLLIKPLITEIMHFTKAKEAYKLLTGKRRPIAIVLKY